jgi:hypothetical protein
LQTIVLMHLPPASRTQARVAFSGWLSQTMGPMHFCFVSSQGGQSAGAQGWSVFWVAAV